MAPKHSAQQDQGNDLQLDHKPLVQQETGEDDGLLMAFCQTFGNAQYVWATLHDRYSITSFQELLQVVGDATLGARIPVLWRLRAQDFRDSTTTAPNGKQQHQQQHDEPQSLPSAINKPSSQGHWPKMQRRSWTTSKGITVAIAYGDLTKAGTEVIVNAANDRLWHGGGLARAIARAGGDQIEVESREIIRDKNKLSVGEAVWTHAGLLPSKFVIHTVGPNVNGNLLSNRQPRESDRLLLHNAVQNALQLAVSLKVKSIALPAISCGIFGYPVDHATRQIVTTCLQFANDVAADCALKRIVLMSNDQVAVQHFASAFNDCLEEFTAGSGDLISNASLPIAETKVNHGTTDESILSRLTSFLYASESSSNDIKSLPTIPQSMHKAAGIVVVRADTDGNDLQLLLGIERRYGDGRDGFGKRINILGGKMELAEDDLDTACREFHEEVGGLVSQQHIKQRLKQSSVKLWLAYGKYSAFFVYVKEREARFANLSSSYEQKKRAYMEQDHLVWVHWSELVQACSSPLEDGEEHGSRFLGTRFGRFRLSQFLVRFVTQYAAQVSEILDQIALEDLLKNEHNVLKEMRQGSNDKLLTKFLGEKWQIQLKSPPVPPPFPIQTLGHDDEEFKQIVASLPSSVSNRVVEVRRPLVSAQATAFAKEYKRIVSGEKCSCQIIKPLYHGTPERWRATAIALNGFDLNHHCSGRSMGDGVYSATDANTALGYCRNVGSLLVMQGIVASNSASPIDNTIVRDPVHVFPNPKVLLPLYIVDFASSNEEDRALMTEHSPKDQSRQEAAKKKQIEEAMRKKEQAFAQEMASRLRASLGLYEHFVTLLAKESKLKRLTQGGEDQDKNNACQNGIAEFHIQCDEGSVGKGPSLVAQLFRERSQFRLSLPVYENKPKVLKSIKRNQVLVLMAETGSGKSTLVPQFVLDDETFTATNTRRIAVLEPRRSNATSLARMVAQERHTRLGEEVGYRIGWGESVVSSTTRIEYMTHGLFVQMAKDTTQLLRRYCCVILDEAHERSVDIDLSLALLKKAVSVGDQDFKTIVMSATIDDAAGRFKQYLAPPASGCLSEILRINGRSFPVHIEHRDEAIFDQVELGTGGFGKVVSSYATQTAIDLIRSTSVGNILVFLPGESHIEFAIATTMATILNDTAQSDEIRHSAASYDPQTGYLVQILSNDWSEKRTKDEVAITTPGANDSDKTHQRMAEYDIENEAELVRVIGFHGKSPRAARDLVLHPPNESTRMIIFTTNLAETGVTIPNVRYVVDSGLERHVLWNDRLGMSEMVTDKVSEGSMKQRTGRAGRTASGICVRLFADPSQSPKKQDEPQSEPTTAVVPSDSNSPSSIQPRFCRSPHGSIYKAILFMKLFESKNDALELLDPLNVDLFKQCEKSLQALGALDEEGQLTIEGETILNMGIPLRMGRFLLACNQFGCLMSGVKLASVLAPTDAAENLLPRPNSDPEMLREYFDVSGDHLTLLNLIDEYDKQRKNSNELNWCRRMRLDNRIFEDCDLARDHFITTLSKLGFEVKDDDGTIESNGGLQKTLLRALCAGYFDQIACARAPDDPKAKFVRLLDATTKEQVLYEQHAFLDRTNPNSHDDTAATTPEGADEEPLLVRVGNRSVIWHLTADKKDPKLAVQQRKDNMICFSSIILTDSAGNTCSQTPSPTVQLVSYVDKDDVEAGASKWCRMVQFDELYETLEHETLRQQLTNGTKLRTVKRRGKWLHDLEKRFRGVFATVKGKELQVSCPRQMMARVRRFVSKFIQSNKPETIKLELPRGANIGKLIGKKAAKLNALRQSIREMVESDACGAGKGSVEAPRIELDSDSRTVKITFDGSAKQLMSSVVARVQNEIMISHGDAFFPEVLGVIGPVGPAARAMFAEPRLHALSSRQPPSGWAKRDDVMLQFVHFLVWQCGLSVYGGFLRDWVVLGQEANDVDVYIDPPKSTAQSVTQQLNRFIASHQRSGGQPQGLRITSQRAKGSAQTIRVEANGMKSFDIDLVDKQRISNIEPPTVDSDAGNLMFDRQKGFCKRNARVGGSLREAIRHIQKHQFVFYYNLNGQPTEAACKRLQKYLDRGWYCLSAVPKPYRSTLSRQHQALIRPKSKYDQPWWTMG